VVELRFKKNLHHKNLLNLEGGLVTTGSANHGVHHELRKVFEAGTGCSFSGSHASGSSVACGTTGTILSFLQNTSPAGQPFNDIVHSKAYACSEHSTTTADETNERPRSKARRRPQEQT